MSGDTAEAVGSTPKKKSVPSQDEKGGKSKGGKTTTDAHLASKLASENGDENGDNTTRERFDRRATIFNDGAKPTPFSYMGYAPAAAYSEFEFGIPPSSPVLGASGGGPLDDVSLEPEAEAPTPAVTITPQMVFQYPSRRPQADVTPVVDVLSRVYWGARDDSFVPLDEDREGEEYVATVRDFCKDYSAESVAETKWVTSWETEVIDNIRSKRPKLPTEPACPTAQNNEEKTPQAASPDATTVPPQGDSPRLTSPLKAVKSEDSKEKLDAAAGTVTVFEEKKQPDDNEDSHHSNPSDKIVVERRPSVSMNSNASSDSDGPDLISVSRSGVDASLPSNPHRDWNAEYQHIMSEPLDQHYSPETQKRDLDELFQDFHTFVKRIAVAYIASDGTLGGLRCVDDIARFESAVPTSQWLEYGFVHFCLVEPPESEEKVMCSMTTEDAFKRARTEVRAIREVIYAHAPHMYAPLVVSVEYCGRMVFAVARMFLSEASLLTGDELKPSGEAIGSEVWSLTHLLGAQLCTRPPMARDASTTGNAMAVSPVVQFHADDLEGRYYITRAAALLPSLPPRACVLRDVPSERAMALFLPEDMHSRKFRGEFLRKHCRDLFVTAGNFSSAELRSSKTGKRSTNASAFPSEQQQRMRRDTLEAYARLHKLAVPAAARRLESELSTLLKNRHDVSGRVAHAMHEEGVNMCFLPHVRQHISDEVLRRLLLEEMVLRTIKVYSRYLQRMVAASDTDLLARVQQRVFMWLTGPDSEEVYHFWDRRLPFLLYLKYFGDFSGELNRQKMLFEVRREQKLNNKILSEMSEDLKAEKRRERELKKERKRQKKAAKKASIAAAIAAASPVKKQKEEEEPKEEKKDDNSQVNGASVETADQNTTTTEEKTSTDLVVSTGNNSNSAASVLQETKKKEEHKLNIGDMDPTQMHALVHASATKSGYMTKRGGIFTTWKRRFFKVIGGHLLYYGTGESPKGRLKIDQALMAILPKEKFNRENVWGFQPQGVSRVYFFQCDSVLEINEWMRFLRSEGASFVDGAPSTKIAVSTTLTLLFPAKASTIMPPEFSSVISCRCGSAQKLTKDKLSPQEEERFECLQHMCRGLHPASLRPQLFDVRDPVDQLIVDKREETETALGKEAFGMMRSAMRALRVQPNPAIAQAETPTLLGSGLPMFAPVAAVSGLQHASVFHISGLNRYPQQVSFKSEKESFDAQLANIQNELRIAEAHITPTSDDSYLLAPIYARLLRLLQAHRTLVLQQNKDLIKVGVDTISKLIQIHRITGLTYDATLEASRFAALSAQLELEKATAHLALPAVSRAFGQNSLLCADAHLCLSEFYDHVRNVEQSHIHAVQALDIRRGVYKTDVNFDVAVAMFVVTHSSCQLGRYREALNLAATNVRLHKQIYPAMHIAIVHSLMELASVLLLAGKTDAASRRYNEALVILREAFESERHNDIVHILMQQGNILRATKKDEEAKAIYEEAVKLSQESNGGPHAQTAQILMNLCLVEHDLFEHDMSAKYFDQSLAMYSKLHSSDPHKLALLKVKLSELVKGMDRPLQAKKLCEEAVAVLRKLLAKAVSSAPGEEVTSAVATMYADVAIGLVTLGEIVEALREYNRATELYDEAATLFSNNAPQHPFVPRALRGQGSVAIKKGRPEEAFAFFDSALDILLSRDECDPVDVAMLQVLVGEALREIHEYHGAIDRIKDALDIYKMVFPSGEHSLIARGMLALANVHAENRDLESSKTLYEQALLMALDLHDRALAAEIQFNIGNLCRSMAAPNVAVVRYGKALQFFEALYPEGHPATAETMSAIGASFHEQDAFSDAKDILLRAIELYNKVLPDSHPHVADTLMLLSEVYVYLKDGANASVCLQRCLKIRTEFFGSRHPEVANCYYKRGKLNHYVLSQPAEAVEDYRRALDIFAEHYDETHPEVLLVHHHLKMLT